MMRSGGFGVPGAAVPGGVVAQVCVGRREEVRRLAALARDVAAGRGAAVLVEGEPGIGKSTLLDVVAAECTRLGVRVVRGEAEELEQRLPFAVVSAALGARPGASGSPREVTRLAGLLAGENAFESSMAAANHELAVTEAVLELMDRWCAAGPVALVLDDLQWADRASAVVLHRLGRAVERERLPLLLVLAARPVPRGEAVAGLVRSLAAHGARSLALAPLPGPAVAELVGRLVGVRPGPRLLGLVAGAGGNPMYVAEVLAALSREDLVRQAGEVADVTSDVAGSAGEWVPASLVEAVRRRLGFVPAKVRDVLEAAAVLGSSVDVAELSAVLGMPLAALAEVLAEATAAGLLADAGGTLVFRHDVIRQVLAGNRSASARSALRLRAGQVLAAAGAPVERVAEHLVAGATLEPATVEWLVRSAEALTVRAPEMAVRLLRQAFATAAGDMAGVLRFHLVRALLWAGELAEAERTALAALAAGAAPGREGALRWLLAQARHRQGRVADVLATAEEAVGSPQLTLAEVGRFHGFAAVGFVLLGRLEESGAAAGKALAAGEASRDAVATLYGYYSLAARYFLLGEQALRFSERAIAVLEGDVQPGLEVTPQVIRGNCLVGLDRFGEADDALVAALRRTQQSGGMHMALSYAVRARMRFLGGRWDDALAEIRAGEDLPDPYHHGVALPPLAALVAVHRGTPVSVPVPRDIRDVEDAGRGGGAGDSADSLGYRFYGYLVRWARALAEEAHGNPRPALDLLYPVWEEPGMQPRRITYEICPDLARMAAAVGDTGRARELAATTGVLATRLPSPSMEGTAMLCRGMADADPDPVLDAARCFRQAGRPLYEGYGYEEAAVLLAGCGRTAEAREALGRALVLYAGPGATWDTARAQARLRQAGVH